MKAKHLSAKEKSEGRTCCFEIARNGALGPCRQKAVAKLGNSCLCLEHLEWASSLTHDVEYVINDKTIVKRAQFIDSLNSRPAADPAVGQNQNRKKRGGIAV